MASAVFHIKDSYYFEIPGSLTADVKTMDDVPGWLVQQHPDAALSDFQHELDGKILIPQPFGTPGALYPGGGHDTGFCISKFMILQLLIAIALVVLFARMAKRMRSGEPVSGRLHNFLEATLVYIRDEVARPAIGHHHADRFVPLLWTTFFFILSCNLMGLVPFMGTPTSAWGTTFALAMVILSTGLMAGMRELGVVGYFKNYVLQIDMPGWMLPLKLVIVLVIFVIEIASNLIRHVVLSIRLLANMVAGHLVLLGILGMAVTASESGSGSWPVAAGISVLGSILFSCLELFVSFLQAYVFTFLSALFIGSAVHEH
jgi:F-type H+-transporting ATPase subunit a